MARGPSAEELFLREERENEREIHCNSSGAHDDGKTRTNFAVLELVFCFAAAFLLFEKQSSAVFIIKIVAFLKMHRPIK